MSNVVISPNMNMPVPVVAVEPGPDWATDINASLSIVDSHNHTPGQGVPITPAAININTDLPMNNNNLTSARTLRFSPQGSAPANPADLGCLVEISDDLYFIDGAGNVVRLTQSGAPAGATGTITGLPSGTASASFAGTTFTFQSSTNTPASLAVGPTKIAQAVTSGKGVTISANVAQAADYDLTLPIALSSSSQGFVVSDASGNLSFDPLAWIDYTPTLTAGVTLNAGSSVTRYRRVGQNLEIYGDLKFSTITAPIGSFNFGLPTGLTVASADYPNGSVISLGTCYFIRLPSSNFYSGVVQWDGNTAPSGLVFSTGYAASGAGGFGVLTLAANQLNSGDFFGFTASIKCTQFS